MRFLLLPILCLMVANLSAQDNNPNYNQKLADSLGSDEYGMKAYVLVILKSGSNKETDKTKLDSLFRGHMTNINRLVNDHKLIVAGPMQKNANNYRGIFILDVKTVEEAAQLLQLDPAVQSKVLEAELYGWYGSAALPLYLEGHKKIEKKGH